MQGIQGLEGIRGIQGMFHFPNFNFLLSLKRNFNFNLIGVPGKPGKDGKPGVPGQIGERGERGEIGGRSEDFHLLFSYN